MWFPFHMLQISPWTNNRQCKTFPFQSNFASASFKLMVLQAARIRTDDISFQLEIERSLMVSLPAKIPSREGGGVISYVRSEYNYSHGALPNPLVLVCRRSLDLIVAVVSVTKNGKDYARGLGNDAQLEVTWKRR